MKAVNFPSSGVLLLNTLIVLLALLFGLMAVVLPWWFVVTLMILPLALMVSALFPEMGLVLFVVLVSGLIPEAMSPSISLGPGKLQAHELIIGLLMVIGVFRLREKGLLTTQWSWPIYAILLCAGFGCIVAILYSGVQVRDLLQEARVQIYWLLMPLTVVLIQEPKALKRFLVGIIFVSLLVSVAVLTQFFFDIKILSTARVESLNTLTKTYSDITRSTAGGAIYWIVFSIFLVFMGAVSGRLSILAVVPLVLVMSGAVVVSFGRGVWISMLLSALLLGWMTFRLKGIIVVFVMTVVVSVSAVGAIAVVKPRIFEVAIERVASTAQEGDPNSSLGWRFVEANYAWISLARSPLIGIGLGAAYKPFERVTGSESDLLFMRYIHNSYLGVWMKMGILGLLAVLWTISQTFYLGWRMAKNASHPGLKMLAATVVAGFSAPIFTSMTQPEWLASTGITYFALMIGMLAVISRLDQRVSHA
jgi:O-antigen ligase